MWSRAPLVLLALAAPAGVAAAQVTPQPGERVRVYASTGTVEGTLVALDTDTVRLVPRQGGDERAVPLARAARLEVQRGRRPAPGKGAAIGLGIGAVIGMGLALATADSACEPGVDPGCLDTGTQTVAGAGVGALIGVGVGAIIGIGAGQEAWVPVRLRDARLGVVPGRGGFGVALSVRF